MKLVIVSGLSGSGKSVALHTLEDLGYYCIDNLPVGLLEPFALGLTEAKPILVEQAAVGIDARNQLEDLVRFPAILEKLKQHGILCEILFLQANDTTLLKRFNETRRRHPLTGDDLTLADAIREERRLLEPILINAQLHIDTTHTNIHELRRLIQERLIGKSAGALALALQSFGYKHGIPEDADFVFDARCLPNPHWDQQLRPLTGLDEPVKDYLDKQPLTEEMFNDLKTFLATWIPHFEAENRSYLTIAIGCTGGQHRSVYLVNRLSNHFSDQYPALVTRHRELS